MNIEVVPNKVAAPVLAATAPVSEGVLMSVEAYERDLFAFCDRVLCLLVRKGAAEFDAALDANTVDVIRRRLPALCNPPSDLRYLVNCLVSARRGLDDRKMSVDRLCERVVLFIGAFDKFCQKRKRAASSARVATEVWG